MHDAFKMTKGQILAAWRQENQITQEEAAQWAGVSLSCWRDWERDRSDGPPIGTVQYLERKFPGLMALFTREFGKGNAKRP